MSYSDDLKKQRTADSWALRMHGANAPTSTIGGRMEAQRLKADLPRPSPAVLPSKTQFTTAPFFRRGRANQATALAEPRGASGESTHWVSNILCVVAGVVGVIFAASHGVKSGLGDGIAFVVTFVASYLLLRYIKQLVAIAFLGFLLYEIIHPFAGH